MPESSRTLQVALRGLEHAGHRFREKGTGAAVGLTGLAFASLQLFAALTYWGDGVTRCGVAEGGLNLAVLMAVLATLQFGMVPPRGVLRSAYCRLIYHFRCVLNVLGSCSAVQGV